MKKTLLLFFLFINSIFVFSYEKSSLYGSWIEKKDCQRVQDESDLIYLNYEGIKNIYDVTINFFIKNELFIFQKFGYGPVYIQSFEKINDKAFKMIVVNNLEEEKAPAVNVVIQFINDDEIHLKPEDEKSFYVWGNIKEIKLVRFSAFADKKNTGVINDSNVRLRLNPNLDCETWGNLQKGTKVIIKEKSENLFEIDGEKWYWFKVDADNFPDGWIYGKYLDFYN